MTALSNRRVWIAAGLALALVLALQTVGLAQCGMCKAALAGSGNARFIRNFNIGVLVLLIPPVTIFCSIFIALKRHKAFDEDPEK